MDGSAVRLGGGNIVCIPFMRRLMFERKGQCEMYITYEAGASRVDRIGNTLIPIYNTLSHGPQSQRLALIFHITLVGTGNLPTNG